MLITLDTNIIYQALRSKSGASYFILQRVRNREIQIALSVPLFVEYQDVLSRKKTLDDLGLESEDIAKFLRFIAYIAKTYDIYYLFRPNLKDEKDNMIIELAIVSQSRYLVTSNTRDFQNSELMFDQLNVVAPSEFVKIWRRNNV